MVETFVQSTDEVIAFLVGQHNLIEDMFGDVLYATETAARQTVINHAGHEENEEFNRLKAELGDDDLKWMLDRARDVISPVLR